MGIYVSVSAPGFPVTRLLNTDGMEKRFMYLTLYALEVSVTARLFGFSYPNEPRLSWNKLKSIDSGIWAILVLVTSSAVNMLPVKVGMGIFFQLLE